MDIQPGKTYVFTKSGNEVRAIEPTTPYLGQPMWVVERTQGASAGKQMCVPARALVTSAHDRLDSASEAARPAATLVANSHP